MKRVIKIINSSLIYITDWFSTLLDLAGLKHRIPAAVDSLSIKRTLLRGTSSRSSRRRRTSSRSSSRRTRSRSSRSSRSRRSIRGRSRMSRRSRSSKQEQEQ